MVGQEVHLDCKFQ